MFRNVLRQSTNVFTAGAKNRPPARVECEIGQRWYSQGREQARKMGLAPEPPPEQRADEEARVKTKVALEER
jgi:hypothetical protein